jgi:hypothetical protein
VELLLVELLLVEWGSSDNKEDRVQVYIHQEVLGSVLELGSFDKQVERDLVRISLFEDLKGWKKDRD